MSAIPAGLHYEGKPAAIPVYRRRCIMSAMSSDEHVSTQTIKIPLDTSLHGSVMDTKQTMLQFHLQIQNQNPFVDYLNFPRCGANSIFKAFRFMVNGNPVEKINNYAECFEDMLIKLGINADPYHFFHPNPVIPEDGPLHTNFIKPPMVDVMGNTMYRPQMLLDAASAPNVFFGNLNHRQSLTTSTRNPSRTPALGTLYVEDKSTIGTSGESGNQIIATNNQEILNLVSSVFQYLPAGAFTTDHIVNEDYTGTKQNFASRTVHYRLLDADLSYRQKRAIEASQAHSFPASDNAFTYTASTSSRLNHVKEIVIHEGILGMQAVPIDEKNLANSSYSVHTPAEWPYYIPHMTPKMPSYSSQRLQDVTRYYSNCKSIPIGMRSDLTYAQYVRNTSPFVSSSSTARTINLNVVVPLLSGVLGLGADKMFPDMLLSAGKAWLEFDLYPAERAFQVTMDPCRRVPGTIRDYVPYTGAAYGASRLQTGNNYNKFLGPQRALPFYRMQTLHEAVDNRGNRVAKNELNLFLYNGLTGAPTVPVSDEEFLLAMTRCYNRNACLGTHYMLHGSTPMHSGSDTSDVNAAMTNTGAVLDLKTEFVAGGTATTIDPIVLGGSATSIGTPGLVGGFVNNMKLWRDSATARATPDGAGYNTAGADTSFANLLATNLSNIGGIPIPQYVPVASPWLTKDGITACVYVPERDACYGTYLKQAVAQSRRTCADSMNNPSSGVSYSGYKVDYSVSQVELITEQILLPDAVTAQILEGARGGAISYHTTFIGSVNQLATESTTQNQLLTVTGASVNNLTLLFRSVAQLNGNAAQSYNSFSFYNPFACVDYDATLPTSQTNGATGLWDVGGNYVIKNALTSKRGSNFNCQLSIGNELLPRQPIRDLPTLLMENEKGVQTIADYSAKLPYLCPMINSILTNANQESYYDYNCLEDGFLSVFLSLDALDDQTITGNPFFASVDLDPANTRFNTSTGTTSQLTKEYAIKTAGLRCPAELASTNSLTTKATRGVINRFTPLEGTFHMCFNLDTFVLEGGSARCGTTIVNNQLFFRCQDMNMMAHTIRGYAPKVEILALWQQDAKIVFEAGGNCVSYI